MMKKFGDHAGLTQTVAVFAMIAATGLAACERVPNLKAPEKFKSEARALATGKFAKVSDELFLFSMGAAGEVMEKCPKVDVDQDARLELVPFMAAAVTQMSTGTKYDYGLNNLDDLPDAMADQLASQSAYFAGIVAARGLNCNRSDATAVVLHAQSLTDVIVNGPDGKGGPFLASCSPVHGAQACKCLGMVGLATDTGIFMSTYSRETIYSIMSKNPLTGLAIGLQCGIMNY